MFGVFKKGSQKELRWFHFHPQSVVLHFLVLFVLCSVQQCCAKCFLLHTYSVHLSCLFISLLVQQYMCQAFFNSLLLLSRLLFNQRLNFSWQCCHLQCRVCGPRTGDRGHDRVAEIGKVTTQAQTQKEHKLKKQTSHKQIINTTYKNRGHDRVAEIGKVRTQTQNKRNTN